MEGFVLAAIGLFIFTGALLEWEWFMNHRKARFLIRILGRTGARVFYIVTGLLIAVAALLGYFGVIDLSS